MKKKRKARDVFLEEEPNAWGPLNRRKYHRAYDNQVRPVRNRKERHTGRTWVRKLQARSEMFFSKECKRCMAHEDYACKFHMTGIRVKSRERSCSCTKKNCSTPASHRKARQRTKNRYRLKITKRKYHCYNCE